MDIFVIQVITLSEEKYMSLAKKTLAVEGFPDEEAKKLFWPRRSLEIRKAGKKTTRIHPLFPGYIFYQSESVETEIYRILKRTPGFMRFLKDNHHIEPLAEADKNILRHFLSFGSVAENSRVVFDENNRIQIIDGPLKGLEGKIIKVDKRKKRARVQLSLYKESFPIDLGFEIMAPAGAEG